MFNRDIRRTPLYREIEAHFTNLYRPGSGLIVDGADLTAAPGGRLATFTGFRLESIEGPMASRVCLADLDTGHMEIITAGPHNDRLPRWSPDGGYLAFLSDRAQRGRCQLFLLRTDRLREVVATPRLDGTAEYLAWSPSGRQILVGVAGLGADLAGIQGGGRTAEAAEPLPSWVPTMHTGDAENLWRRIWVHDLAGGGSQVLSRPGLNVWESTWCGDGAVAAIVSDSHGEGSWYRARLALIDLDTGREKILYRPADQLGWPAANPSGRQLAVVEAVSSDRYLVCGTVLLLDPATGTARALDTRGVDVSWVTWRDDDRLLYAGHRDWETVVGEYDLRRDAAVEYWSSTELTSGAWYPTVSPIGESDCLMMVEGHLRPPEVVVVRDNRCETVLSLGHPGAAEEAARAGHMHPAHWTAPDGLEIHGWLVTPDGERPFPLVTVIHGGPVWANRNRYYARLVNAQPLVSRGCALFLPNPRGSTGRGQDFARLVRGDMGGADVHDYLSGLDALVQQGIAHRDQLGVTGVSYGGYMSCWLITQDSRFAAAVPISPVTDWCSQHFTSQIPDFDALFLEDDPSAAGGLYYQRSPVMFAGRVRTPTLILAGEMDQNTPPSQALAFHRALIESGAESVLALYPHAVHGARSFPEVVDSTTRQVDWFLRHMQISRPQNPR
jgi:dipeptidyl aminopeptidase/acylaminoacyl peptidase